MSNQAAKIFLDLDIFFQCKDVVDISSIKNTSQNKKGLPIIFKYLCDRMKQLKQQPEKISMTVKHCDISMKELLSSFAAYIYHAKARWKVSGNNALVEIKFGSKDLRCSHFALYIAYNCDNLDNATESISLHLCSKEYTMESDLDKHNTLLLHHLYIQIIEVLYSKAVLDPNSKDPITGNSLLMLLLHMASNQYRNERTEQERTILMSLIKTVITNGANIQDINCNGESLLFLSWWSSHEDIWPLLEERNVTAVVNQRDSKSLTALESHLRKLFHNFASLTWASPTNKIMVLKHIHNLICVGYNVHLTNVEYLIEETSFSWTQCFIVPYRKIQYDAALELIQAGLQLHPQGYEKITALRQECIDSHDFCKSVKSDLESELVQKFGISYYISYNRRARTSDTPEPTTALSLKVLCAAFLRQYLRPNAIVAVPQLIRLGEIPSNLEDILLPTISVQSIIDNKLSTSSEEIVKSVELMKLY